MKIHNMETGETVETTPEEFMKHIQPNIDEWKKLQEKLTKRSEEHTSNSSHTVISYAVFCLKKKKKIKKNK